MLSPNLSDNDEETDEESVQISSVMVKLGNTFKNIIPIKEKKEIYVDDWVLVSFERENSIPSCSKNTILCTLLAKLYRKKTSPRLKKLFKELKEAEIIKAWCMDSLMSETYVNLTDLKLWENWKNQLLMEEEYLN